jgi:hypothetical protein
MKESDLVDELVNLFSSFPHLWRESEEFFNCKVLSIAEEGGSANVFELHIYAGDFGFDDFVLVNPITHSFGFFSNLRLRKAVARWNSHMNGLKINSCISRVCEQEYLRNCSDLIAYE